MGDYQLRDRHQSPTKADVKREISSLKRSWNNLQTPYEWRGRRVEKLLSEKRDLLDIINDDKNVLKRYTDASLLDNEKVY